MKKITAKSTKQEILDAYKEILKQYEEIKKQKLLDIKEVENEEIKLNDENNIFSALNQVKDLFNKTVGDLEIDLKFKFDELKNLDEKIKQEKNYLENILGIKAKSESLYALQDLYNQKELEIDQDLKQKRKELEVKQKEWDFEFENKKKQDLMKWEIEKEAKKTQFEQDMRKKLEELQNKENKLNGKEEEFVELKEKYENLQKEYENLSSNLETQIREKIKGEYALEKKMLLKDFELKEKLFEQEIVNLKQSIEVLLSEKQKLEETISTLIKRIEVLSSKAFDSKRPIVVGTKSE